MVYNHDNYMYPKLNLTSCLLPSGHRNHNHQPVYNHDAPIHNYYIYNALCSINTLHVLSSVHVRCTTEVTDIKCDFINCIIVQKGDHKTSMKSKFMVLYIMRRRYRNKKQLLLPISDAKRLKLGNEATNIEKRLKRSYDNDKSENEHKVVSAINKNIKYLYSYAKKFSTGQPISVSIQ